MRRFGRRSGGSDRRPITEDTSGPPDRKITEDESPGHWWSLFPAIKLKSDKPKARRRRVNRTAKPQEHRVNITSGANAYFPELYGPCSPKPHMFAVGMDGPDFIFGLWYGFGEIEEFTEILINGEAVPAAVTVEEHKGTSTQVVSTILSNLSGYTHDLVIDVNGTDRGLAYLALRVPPEAVKGFPKVSVKLKGNCEIEDTRTSTTAYSDVPALCWRHWLKTAGAGPEYNVEDSSFEALADFNEEVPGDTWIASYNYSLLNFAKPIGANPLLRIYEVTTDAGSSGGSEPIWNTALGATTTDGGITWTCRDGRRSVCGLETDVQADISSWMESWRTLCGCMYIFGESGVEVLPDAIRATDHVFKYEDGQIINDLSLKQTRLKDRPTVVQVTYTNTAAEPWRDATVRVAMAGVNAGTVPERISGIKIPGIQRTVQAIRVAIERLNATNLTDLSFSLSVFDDGLKVRAGDVIEVTDPIGLVDKKMRVLNAHAFEPGRWLLDLWEYDPAVYSNHVETESTYPDFSLNTGVNVNASQISGLTVLGLFSETFEAPLATIDSDWPTYSGSGETAKIAAGEAGGNAYQIGNNVGNDQRWMIWDESIPFDPGKLYCLRVRIRQDAGVGTCYIGVAGRNGADDAWVNNVGADFVTGQHYIMISNGSPGVTYVEYTGYIKGTAVTGDNVAHPDPTDPAKLHEDVRYIRPLMLVNYTGAVGQYTIDEFTIEILSEVKDQISGKGINICHARYSSFEEAALPPIVSSNGIVTQDSTVDFFGGNSLKMAATAADHYCYLASAATDYNTKIAPNEKWILSVYNRCNKVSKVIRLRIKTSAGTWYYVNTTSHAIINTWKRVSCVIDLTLDDSTQCLLCFDNEGGAGCDMHWDGIMLEAQTGNLEEPSIYAMPSAITFGWEPEADVTQDHTAQNLQYGGDFELDVDNETNPTHWTRTLHGPAGAVGKVVEPVEANWPPWKVEGHCFHASCNDVTQYVKLTSDYFIPISQDSSYCLNTWVHTNNSCCYLGVQWFDKNKANLSSDHVCLDNYQNTHAWEYKTSEAFKPSDYEVTARYMKILSYPQYQRVGWSRLSRIQLVESKTGVAWEVSYAVAPGADVTVDNTADNANNYTGADISTGHTAAKCTDADADETITHKALDTIYINGSINQSGQGAAKIYDDLEMQGTDISFYHSSSYKGGIYGTAVGVAIVSGAVLILQPSSYISCSADIKPASPGGYDSGTPAVPWDAVCSRKLNVSTGDVTMATSGNPMVIHLWNVDHYDAFNAYIT